jgi:hypothetical protein
MNEYQLLISRYIDGELNDAEVSTLAEKLRTDPELVQRLVLDSFIHTQLLNWLNQDSGDGAETAAGVPDGRGESTSDKVYVAAKLRETFLTSGGSRPRHSVGRHSKWRTPSLWSTAIVLFIAVGVSALGYYIAARPTIVGQLTESRGAKWNSADGPSGAGALLHSGQNLVLTEGSAIITFASGAKVHLEGPATIRLLSDNDMELINGRIAARVPHQAVGFTVRSSISRIVDLGTAFTLSLKAEKSFELYVFEGLVELQLDERFGAAAHQPVRVAQVHALSFDVKSGDVAPMKFEQGKSMPF